MTPLASESPQATSRLRNDDEKKKSLQSIPVMVYDFRCHKIIKNDDGTEEDLNYIDIIKMLKKYAKSWVFQLEKGTQSGYLHYQGRMSLIKKRRPEQLKKLIKDNDDEIQFIEPTVTKEHRKTAFYQMKIDTRVEGPWDDKNNGNDDQDMIMTRQLSDFNKFEQYHYQKKLAEMSQQYNARKIDIIYDEIGNCGKSVFCEWMRYNKLAVKIPPYRQLEDMMGFICSMRLTSKCYIIDMPRALKKDKLAEFYSGIEEIKNGVCYDKRYKGAMLNFDRPRVFVFTNTLPNYELLSRDRWNTWTINNDKELVRYFDEEDDEDNAPEITCKKVLSKEDKEEKYNKHINEVNYENIMDEMD